MDCPKCKAVCFWVVVGTDPHFGEIKELSCSECGWSEGDSVDLEEKDLEEDNSLS